MDFRDENISVPEDREVKKLWLLSDAESYSSKTINVVKYHFKNRA